MRGDVLHRPDERDATESDAARQFGAAVARLAQPVEPFRVLDPTGEVVGPEPPDLSADALRDLYRWLVFGRELDGRALRLQRQGRLGIWGPTAGQEATQVALGLTMRDGDWLFPSYREVVTATMRGLDLTVSLNYLRGLYWQADPRETGMFPVQILIGDQSLHAVGAGMAFALQDEPRVAVASIGDGATSEGDFHEALNFAGVFQARSVIFIQNNGWAISLPRTAQTASASLAQKALAYGIEGVMVDGNDPLALYQVLRWAMQRARTGGGPALVEAVTYRMGAHTTADDPTRYQPPADLELWRTRDPLVRMRRYLEQRDLWGATQEEAARADALTRIDDAITRMEATPVPSPTELLETTYATPTPAQRAQLDELRGSHQP